MTDHEPIEMEGLQGPSSFGNAETKPTAPADAGPLPEKIGPYRVKRRIATGGMGSVYEAIQDNPRRTVALKVMRAGITSPAALRRFEYEAQILARLRHTGIAQIYQAGTHEGDGVIAPYFAMEYVPGARTLVDYAEAKDLSDTKRIELFTLVCEAVHHGHQKGIIHRDLKPGNILVDSSGQPKVIDFGVARSTDSDVALATFETEVGQLLGTLQYMSPEQCDADPHDLDTRSDVYSLGVLLFELLCGELPYDVSGVAIYEATRVIREKPPTRPATTARHLSGDAETILLKALEKDRDRRYGSALDLAEDLRRFLRGDPITAQRPSLGYQLRLLARRNRALFVAGTVVFLTLVAGVIGTSWGLLESKQSEADALAAKDVADLERARAEDALEDARRSEREASREREAAETARGEAESAREAETAERRRAEEALLEAERARAAETLRNEELVTRAYSSAVAAADGALRTFDMDAAREHLASAPAELRGWEWYALANGVDRSSHTFFGHTRKISGIAVDPSGFRLASSDRSGTIRVWDLFSTRELLHFQAGPSDAGTGSVAFTRDGSAILAPTSSDQIGLWDAETGALLRRFEAPVRRSACIDTASEADRFVVVGDSLCVFDLATGQQLLGRTVEGRRFVSAALDPSGELVAARTMDSGLFVFDVGTGELLFDPVLEEHVSMSGVDFDPAGERVASISRNHLLQILDARTGELLQQFDSRLGSFTVEFDPTGERLVVGGIDGTIEVWDIETGESLAALRGHERFAMARFHPDGRRIVSGAWDRTIKIWEIPRSLHPVPTPAGRLTAFLEASADGSRVFVPGYISPGGPRRDSTVSCWDPQRGQMVWTAEAWMAGRRVTASTTTRGGDQLVVALDDGTVAGLDAETGAVRGELRLDATPSAIAAQPDGGLLAVVAGSSIHVVSSDHWVVVGELNAPVELYTVAFHATGSYIVAGGEGAIQVWEADSGFTLWEIPVGREKIVSITFAGNDHLITVREIGNESYEIDSWDLARERPWRTTLAAVEADFAPPEVREIPGLDRFIVGNLNPARLPIYSVHSPEPILILRNDLPVVYSIASVSPTTLVLHDLVGHMATVDTSKGIAIAAEIDALPAAREWVDELVKESLSLADLLARLREDEAVDESTRAAALRYALSLKLDDGATEREIDLIVYDAELAPEDYTRALERAIAYEQTRPRDGDAVRRLGFALYRAERFEEAVTALERAVELARPDEHLLGFLAMAQWRLGHEQDARESLGRFRGALDGAPDYLGYRLLREVEALFEAAD